MQLASANWYRFCDSFGGTLDTAKTWHILKAILDPTKTKGEGHRLWNGYYTPTQAANKTSSMPSRPSAMEIPLPHNHVEHPTQDNPTH